KLVVYWGRDHDSPVYRSLAFSPDGDTLAIGGDLSLSARFWDVGARCERASLPHPEVVRGIAYSPSGKLFATSCAGRPDARHGWWGRNNSALGHQQQRSGITPPWPPLSGHGPCLRAGWSEPGFRQPGRLRQGVGCRSQAGGGSFDRPQRLSWFGRFLAGRQEPGRDGLSRQNHQALGPGFTTADRRLQGTQR